MVRTDLVGESDATAFMAGVIDQHSAADIRDNLQRLCELLAAVTALRAENVAGEALGMDAGKNRIGRRHVAKVKHD